MRARKRSGSSYQRDVRSEGLNLQDATRLANYDIHFPTIASPETKRIPSVLVGHRRTDERTIDDTHQCVICPKL